jgi:hypothetical protein
MNPSGPPYVKEEGDSSSRWRVFAASMVVLLLGGCTTGLGPKAVRSERPDYNQQIVRSGDEQMLLNLVRLRYNDSPLFLELGSVVASYSYEAGFSAGGTISPNPGGSSANLGTALGYSEHPTVTYSPLTGDQFAERLLSPIPLDSIMLFAQSGWNVERLLLVTALRVNDLFNSPASTGPTPERAPQYETFAEFAEHFHHLQQAGLIELNWERKGHETNAPGRDPHFWIGMPANTNSPSAADVIAVRSMLGLQPGRDDFSLSAFPFKRQPNELGIRCRSLLGVLYFLSTAVEPPVPHVKAGLLTVTRDDTGQPFDWSKFTGKVMTIHSRQDRPAAAAVAVPYRGWWFYLADNDQNSKITFNLLNILFQLQATTAAGKSPVLTLSVGN